MTVALAMAVENGMVAGAADAYERQHEPIPEAERQHALDVADAAVAFAGDLGDELFEVDVELDAAIRTGDATLIGRIVLGVRQALVHRLAVRSLGSTERMVTAKQAAAAVFVMWRAAS